jgi:hypothetical protein
MPPRLVHGGPTGQRKLAIPTAQHLCLCYQCVTVSSIDPVSLKPVKGRYVGYEEYKRHRSQENKSGLAPASALASAAPTIDFTSPQASRSPSLSPTTPLSQGPSGPAAADLEGDRSSRSSSSTFRLHLDAIFQALDSEERSVDEILSGAKLVFHVSPQRDCQPPSTRSAIQCEEINSGPFALASNVASNSRVIGYEEWLFESYWLVSQHGPKHADAHVRLRSTVVLRRIEGFLQQLEERKRQEWDRQRAANDIVEEVDTSFVDPC